MTVNLEAVAKRSRAIVNAVDQALRQEAYEEADYIVTKALRQLAADVMEEAAMTADGFVDGADYHLSMAEKGMAIKVRNAIRSKAAEFLKASSK